MEEMLRIRLEKQMKEELEAEALKLDRSVGWVVRKAIEEWLGRAKSE